MTLERQRTVRRLAVSAGALLLAILAFLAWVVWLLVIEGQALAQGGDSTISRVLWGVWSEEPWVILLVCNVAWALACTAACTLSFLGGHFFAQRSSVYDGIRSGELP